MLDLGPAGVRQRGWTLPRRYISSWTSRKVELRNETIGMDRGGEGCRGESDPVTGQQDRQQGVC